MIRSILLCALAAPMPLWAQGVASPYAQAEQESPRALSAEEVRAYLAGEGMGYAKAAELNHYPGPRHVLDAADALRLTAEQSSAVRAIRERMRARAVRLGERVVELERELDLLFAGGRADSSGVRLLVEEWGRLQGELRAVHLWAHLETTRWLTREQVARYDVLRGYTHPAPGAGAEHRHDPD